MDRKYLKYKIKYNNLKQQNLVRYSSLIQNGGSKDKDNKTIYLFKAEWCGHCKEFSNTWEALKKKYHKKINFVTYDSDKNAKEVRDAKIEGYPTIILNKGEKAIEYNGPRNIDSLSHFIDKN